MTNNKGVRRDRKWRRKRISVKLTRKFVFWVFLLFAISLVVALGIGAAITTAWKLDNYGNVLVYTAIVLVISLVVGTSLAAVYSKIMMKTASPYIEALQRIGECDFSVRLEDNNFMPGLDLAEHFNAMVEQLANVETLHESFVSDFSHEFKTPIVSIAGFASLLKNPNLSDAERNEYLDVIIDESNRLVGLSESVLMLSRLDGQVVVDEPYRLDEQLRQCVLMTCKGCACRNIEVDLQTDCDTIVGCQKLNSQLWVNLLSNAVKFTPDGGRITVRAYRQDNNIVVSVADSGIGMDEETKKQIFNKFYQGDKSHTTPGNGLGLSIVKKIVDLQDGIITVDSVVGQGSCFTVTLAEPRE